MQSQGFFTLATGDIYYYQLAYNLLISFRKNGNCKLPFAIIADRENAITAHFDKVVILKNPTNSFLDKIEMLNLLPFDQNVFIDADSLVYSDISYLIDKVKTGVTCFGITVSLSESGWFNPNYLGRYQERVSSNYQTHNGIILVTKDDVTENVYRDCLDITSAYSSFHFSFFVKPADEPILALAMAINRCLPLNRIAHNSVYGFYPTLRYVKMNIAKSTLSYIREGNDWVENVGILHWQNEKTHTAEYQREVDRLNNGNTAVVNIKYYFRKFKLYLHRCLGSLYGRIRCHLK